jgi:hypothetical protein
MTCSGNRGKSLKLSFKEAVFSEAVRPIARLSMLTAAN